MAFPTWFGSSETDGYFLEGSGTDRILHFWELYQSDPLFRETHIIEELRRSGFKRPSADRKWLDLKDPLVARGKSFQGFKPHEYRTLELSIQLKTLKPFDQPPRRRHSSVRPRRPPA